MFLPFWLGLFGCPEAPPPEAPPEPADTDTDTGSEPVDDDDADGDGFPSGVDCDDADDEVYPGAVDVCGDDRVTDCDRTSDDGLVTLDGGITTTDLQDALDLAPPGATLTLCGGTWQGGFVADEPLTLVGHDGADRVVLDGRGDDTVLTVVGGTRLVALTLTGGRGTEGGGISLHGGGELVVEGCTITGNFAEYGGGGVWLDDDSIASFPGTVISDNEGATGGGGIRSRGGTSIDLTGAVVSDNTAVEGGGIYLFDAEIVGGEVSGNTALTQGGGIRASGTSGISGVTIADNRASSGGGLWAWAGRFTASGGAIVDNRASYGGAADFESSRVTFVGTELSRNLAFEEGGGVRIDDTTFECTDCVIGADADANLPEDVFSDTMGSYDAPATFTCTDVACTP